MIVDVIIARGANGHVDQRMARQLIQHVIKEPHARLIVILSCPIQIDGHRNLRFGGISRDSCAAHSLTRVLLQGSYIPLGPSGQAPIQTFVFMSQI